MHPLREGIAGRCQPFFTDAPNSFDMSLLHRCESTPEVNYFKVIIKALQMLLVFLVKLAHIDGWLRICIMLTWKIHFRQVEIKL